MILADDLQLKELEKGNLRKKLAFDAIRMCAWGAITNWEKWNWNFFQLKLTCGNHFFTSLLLRQVEY